MQEFFWLVPLFPLGAFAVLALGLDRFGRPATWLSIAALGASTVLSLVGLVAAFQGADASIALPWLAVGGRRFELALWLDPLSALSASLVSVVGLVVLIYAGGYMASDPRKGRFFAEMSLFAGSMLLLVLAADLITLFIAWELVGLCSYLLIGFWFDRPGVPGAASKAFLVTRIGDVALLGGVLLLARSTGSGSIAAALYAAAGDGVPHGMLLAIALLLFAGAAAKSAQVPFQGWLPDAMAGPTPVSALIHSATMVAAGVFLVARFYPLFEAATPSLVVVAWVGAATALLGAAAALVEPDAKRTLAYSTMSQLGLMFVGLGAGSLTAGLLLLLSQGFYKSLLFLAIGGVDHEVHGTDFDRMGGLARRMPLTFAASVVGAAALAGLPVSLALPAKDPVLAAAWDSGPWLFAAALVASLGTALYSARILGLVFLGESREPARHATEAPSGLALPTIALAALLVAIGLVDSPLLGAPLGRMLGTEAPESSVATALALAVAVLGSAAGIAARLRWPGKVVWPLLRPTAALFGSEFGLAPAYRAVAVVGLRAADASAALDSRLFDPAADHLAGWVRLGSRWANGLDRSVLDRFADGLATSTLDLARMAGRFDMSGLDASVRRSAEDLLHLSGRLRRLQTGRIENYLLSVFVWGLAIAVVALLGAALTWR